MYRIVSWNIDGFFSKEAMFNDLVSSTRASFYCLQETKVSDSVVENLKPAGYSVLSLGSSVVHHGGCATFYTEEALSVICKSPSFMAHEGRFNLMEYERFYLLNLYMPNAGERLKFIDRKVESFRWVSAVVTRLNIRKPVIICGDMNVATYYQDRIRVRERRAAAGFSSRERSLLKQFLGLGFVDVLSYVHPTESDLVHYINDKPGSLFLMNGYRLDYILVSKRIVNNIRSVDIHTEYARYKSHHLPMELVIDL